MRRLLASLGLASALIGCEATPTAPTAAAPVDSATAAPGAEDAPAVAAGPVRLREGQALVRGLNEAALYVADEDHSLLRRVAITPDLAEPPPLLHPMPPPPEGAATESTLALPGRPAQVLALQDRLLVTVRDPGLLMVIAPGDPPRELARVALPADAWGVAVAPDLSAAYVSSAWTHRLSKIDLASRTVAWSIEVAREPRGVVVSPDGKKVFVTHLVGAPLTVVDVGAGAGEATPEAKRLDFPPDPMRARYNEKIGASLGYAALLSPDGRRLFVARHALGTAGGWGGTGTVDVWSTVSAEPIAPARVAPPFGTLTKEDFLGTGSWSADEAGLQAGTASAFTQPRAMAYRERTRHLLVAAEGANALVELDAMSIAPAVHVNRHYALDPLEPAKGSEIRLPTRCGAPIGVVLSEDESVAFVYCRSTDSIAAVRLTRDGVRELSREKHSLETVNAVGGVAWRNHTPPWGAFAYARMSVPDAPADVALGRRLFYDATDAVVSGGLACAGCHPEGRDDGHVWRELLKYQTDKRPTFVAGPSIAPDPREHGDRDDGVRYGKARQTPMLAGRVDAVGPYGWHSESATLVDRIKEGFTLHRWWDNPTDGKTMRMRAEPLAAFVRTGLVPPPREERPLSPQEQQGEAIFRSAKSQCADCHVPKGGYTDRSAMPLRGFAARPLFDEDPNRAYKVPSLLFVGGTAPYYHDGSFETLEDLIDKNLDRMGRTSHLTADERAALVAFLKRL
jgi:cytochrome c553